MSTSAAHIKRVREALPFEPMVAVSAESESWLCKQRRAAWIQYDSGAAAIGVKAECGSATPGAVIQQALTPVGGMERVHRIQKTVLDRWVKQASRRQMHADSVVYEPCMVLVLIEQ